MAEFPLLPIPAPEPDQRPPGPRGGSKPLLPSRARQGARLQPVFRRLRSVFDEGRDPLTLVDDPAGIAPERALVLEVAGTIDEFHDAVGRIPGLELIGDEEAEFEADSDFAVPDTREGRRGEPRFGKPVGGRLYLTIPDVRALRELVSLWDRYQAGEQAERGFGPWYDVFRQLYRLRPWGPADRIPEDTISYLKEHLADRAGSRVRVEIELWSHRNDTRQARSGDRFDQALRSAGGEIISQSSIPDVAYEAVLADLPAEAIPPLIQRQEVSLAICDSIMFIRPQSTALFPTDVNALEAGPPPAIVLTLAWFSPVNVRHRSYRRAKLEINPDRLGQSIGVKRASLQPSDKSVPRGSLFHVRYDGASAVPFIDDGHLQFRVYCREQGGPLDRSIRYGLAVTIEAGEGIPVYQEVRQRLGIQPRVAGETP